MITHFFCELQIAIVLLCLDSLAGMLLSKQICHQDIKVLWGWTPSAVGNDADKRHMLHFGTVGVCLMLTAWFVRVWLNFFVLFLLHFCLFYLSLLWLSRLGNLQIYLQVLLMINLKWLICVGWIRKHYHIEKIKEPQIIGKSDQLKLISY